MRTATNPMRLRPVLPLLMVIAGVIAYANTFRAPFIFDDYGAITRNPQIRRLWPLTDALTPPQRTPVTGRPLVNLSFAINYRISRLDPWSYHAFNLLVHILNGLLLFGLLRRTMNRDGPALAGALLWLVHPLLTDSVTYVVQRTELMMACCLLLTLYCVARGWLAWAVVACAAGMACKETMLVAPILVLLYDRAFLAGSFREAWRARNKLYLALAATWLVWLLLQLDHPRGTSVRFDDPQLTPWHYLLTQCGIITHYLRLTFWPHPLALDYSDWPIAHSLGAVWPAAALLVALALGTAWALWRRPALGFLGAWFFLILAPTSSIVPIITEIAAERRMYLPLAAVIIVVVLALAKVCRLRGPAMVLSCVVVTGLSVMTILRNHDYRSVVAIWSDTVAKRPRDARARTNLGVALLEAGQVSRGQSACERALQFDPTLPMAHVGVGRAELAAGDTTRALTEFAEAIRLNPKLPEAWFYTANAQLSLGQTNAAVASYQRAIAAQPVFAEAHNNLAVALLGLGREKEAREQWREAVRLRPDLPEIRQAVQPAPR